MNQQSFDDVTNFKQYFLLEDSFNNISSDLDVVLQQNNKRFYREILKPIMSLFSRINILNDITQFDSSCAEYQYIKNNAGELSLASMNDETVMSQWQLIKHNQDDFAFKEISKITLSDKFILKYPTTIDLLNQIHKNIKVNLIVVKIYDPLTNKTNHINDLVHWCDHNNIHVDIHNEHYSHSVITTKHPDECTTLLPQYPNQQGFQILNRSVLLHGTRLYIENPAYITQTDGKYKKCIYDITNGIESVDGLLVTLLEAKLQAYNKFVQQINSDCQTVNDKVLKYHDYFMYVIHNVTVNEDYTFIPKIILKPYTNIYKYLAKTLHFIETEHGLLKPNAKQIIPIIKINGKPIQRLQHIPILNIEK